MRTIASAATVGGLVMCAMLVSSCSPEDAQKMRIERIDQQRGPKIDTQLQAIKLELEGKLIANNCSPDPTQNLECRNFVVACAVEKPTSAADTANGVARRITFWTSYIARGQKSYGWRSDTATWSDVHGYVPIQVSPDGTWGSTNFGTVHALSYNDPVTDGFCRAKEPGERLYRF